MISEILYDGASNTVVLTLINTSITSVGFPSGTPIPFVSNGVTLMELSLDNVIISSANGDISWDDVGNITIKSNNVGDIIKDISHASSLTVYDPAHPAPTSGQLLIHPKMKYSQLNLETVSSKM